MPKNRISNDSLETLLLQIIRGDKPKQVNRPDAWEEREAEKEEAFNRITNRRYFEAQRF